MYNSFSQSIMEKYGWTIGKGLGKNSQGITNPIKAVLKFDSHGISYKEVDSELSSKWSNIYSAAVSNLQVNDDNSITVSNPCINNEKLNSIGVNVLYKNFVKSTVYLKDGLEVKDENQKSKKRKREISEEVDRRIVKKVKKKMPKSEVDNLLQSEFPIYDKIKAKKSKSKCLFNDFDQNNIKFDNDDVKIKKSKKKSLSDNVQQEECTLDEMPTTHQKKKSKKKSLKDNVEQEESTLNRMTMTHKKKKCLLGDIEQEHVKLDRSFTNDKTDKKSKKKHLPEEDIPSSVELIKLNENEEKKSKKKSKKRTVNEGLVSLEEINSSAISNSTFMTCYPAARCGIGISGKLARIQKLQDAEKRNSLSIQSFS